ncbi:MAG: hypothetical protein IH845_05185 [Nanoarchaeota archaeon]|nr:hypothetical protein [Nanoarchaeota archaeon]
MDLQNQKKDTEEEIFDLKKTEQEVNALLISKNPTTLSFLKLNACLKEIKKELRYSDYYLQELNEGIKFNK